MSPNISLIVIVLYITLLIFFLTTLRVSLVQKIGSHGFALLCGFCVAFLIPPFCWVLGLSSLLNDTANPILRGTGGTYGLEYDYYFVALAIYLSIPTGACLIALMSLKGGRSVHRLDLINLISKVFKVRKIAYVGIALALFFTLYYFYVVGWDRIWVSNLSRFEFDDYDRGDFSLKIATTLLLVFGCLGATLVLFKDVFWLATAIVFISSLPFIAFASRGGSVLALAYLAALFYRSSATQRWLFALPSIFIIYVSLQMPLAMRSQGQTGLLIAAQSALGARSTNESILEGVAGISQNIGQGFGLLVEERFSSATGRSIIDGIPLPYFLWSFSPTTSAIDGFSEKWLFYNPRFNLYSPYGGLCELVAINPFFGIIFPLFLFYVFLHYCRFRVGRSVLEDLGLIAMVLVAILGFLQLQQYPVRTAMRFFYAGLFLFYAMQFVSYLVRVYYAGQPLPQFVSLLNKNKMNRQKQGR